MGAELFDSARIPQSSLAATLAKRAIIDRAYESAFLAFGSPSPSSGTAHLDQLAQGSIDPQTGIGRLGALAALQTSRLAGGVTRKLME
jgi:hypothetical protein